MDVKIEPSWKELLNDEFEKPYFATLAQFVKKEYASTTIYPPGKLIFASFDYCKLDELKVVILGQDPYHGEGQANGLCFSVNDGIKSPPSLVNIFKEIKDDLGTPIPSSGNLERWARQGILLLNATLTVRANQPGTHQKQGWETFTDRVIQLISEKKQHVVFILWGAYAMNKAELIDQSKHLILTSAHPSPFSVHRGFFGCKHFSKTNEYLAAHQKTTIHW
jgi:uracil-DNA glycosylase